MYDFPSLPPSPTHSTTTFKVELGHWTKTFITEGGGNALAWAITSPVTTIAAVVIVPGGVRGGGHESTPNSLYAKTVLIASEGTP